MQSKDKHGPGYAKKQTRCLTNSVVPARLLSRRCPENHRHVHLMERGEQELRQFILKSFAELFVERPLNKQREMQDSLCASSASTATTTSTSTR